MLCLACQKDFPWCECDNWNERFDDLQRSPHLAFDFDNILSERQVAWAGVDARRRINGLSGAQPLPAAWWSKPGWRTHGLPPDDNTYVTQGYRGISIYRRQWINEANEVKCVSLWFSFRNRRGGIHCLPTEERISGERLLAAIDTLLDSKKLN